MMSAYRTAASGSQTGAAVLVLSRKTRLITSVNSKRHSLPLTT